MPRSYHQTHPGDQPVAVSNRTNRLSSGEWPVIKLWRRRCAGYVATTQQRAQSGATMTMQARGRKPHLLSVLVLVVGVGATVAAFILASASVRHSDQLLLRQDAAQGSLVLGSFVGQAPPAVASLAQTLSDSGSDASSWDAVASAVAAANAYSALALLKELDDRFVVVAAVGTVHGHFGTPSDASVLSALSHGHSPYFGATDESGKRWLTQFVSSRSAPGYFVYSEQPESDKPISLSSLPGHPFSGVDGAVYVGHEAASNLVFASTTHLPLTGERAVAVIGGTDPFTSSPATLNSHVGSFSAPGDFVLVMRATSALSGTSSEVLPWVLLIAGLAFAVSMAGLLELSERRRDRVLTALEQLEQRNADLDQAVALQRRTDARFAAMVRSSSDLTTVISADGTVLYQSPSSEKMLGIRPDDLVGTNLRTFVHPGDEQSWQRAMAKSEATPEAEVSTEWRLRTSDGTYVAVETRMTNLLEDSAVSGIVLNSRDVTDRSRLEYELRHQAFHDSLTGLANRALFEDRLENALARLTRAKGVLGVLFLDLDDFKAVNDGRGHNVGDELLRAVSDRLRGTIRAGDTLARIGGDEFAVLVEGKEASGAPQTAKRILEALRSPFVVGTGGARVRASIGLVTTTNSQESTQELLRNADIAMYAAKNAGKGRIEVFHPGLHNQVIDKFQLEVDLGRALENDELSVLYQPIVDLATNDVVGIEALMRWTNPGRGLVMPGEFIPVAESTGLIVPMGKWLLRQACWDVCRVHRESGRPDIHLAVNLSARQLEDPELVKDVETAVNASGLSAGLLTLEITESVFMAHPGRSLEVLHRLKELGVRLSIDDFGTGYSSLGYLQQLPVDELKIDRTFVVATGGTTESDSLVQTIVDLAQNFGLGTVAEGIETEAQLLTVRETGCDLAQGYLFAKPVALDALREVLVNLHGSPAPIPMPASGLSKT